MYNVVQTVQNTYPSGILCYVRAYVLTAFLFFFLHFSLVFIWHIQTENVVYVKLSNSIKRFLFVSQFDLQYLSFTCIFIIPGTL